MVSPKSETSKIIGNQLNISAILVAANYVSACRARSKADFINKLGIVIEEADESLFWIELLISSGKIDIKDERIIKTEKELNELISIFVVSCKTAKSNYKQ